MVEIMANHGVIDKDYVNNVVHGHEPTPSNIIETVLMKKDLINKEKKKGQRE